MNEASLEHVARVDADRAGRRHGRKLLAELIGLRCRHVGGQEIVGAADLETVAGIIDHRPVGLLRLVREGLQRIEELVAEMLTLARVESGPTSRAALTSDLIECVSKTVRELETFAGVRQVDIAIDCLPAGPCAVRLGAEDCALIVGPVAIPHFPPSGN